MTFVKFVDYLKKKKFTESKGDHHFVDTVKKKLVKRQLKFYVFFHSI